MSVVEIFCYMVGTNIDSYIGVPRKFLRGGLKLEFPSVTREKF